MLLVRPARSAPVFRLGPFHMVRAGAALIWGDDQLLALRIPGWGANREAVYEVSLIAAGG